MAVLNYIPYCIYNMEVWKLWHGEVTPREMHAAATVPHQRTPVGHSNNLSLCLTLKLPPSITQIHLTSHTSHPLPPPLQLPHHYVWGISKRTPALQLDFQKSSVRVGERSARKEKKRKEKKRIRTWKTKIWLNFRIFPSWHYLNQVTSV